MNYYIDIKITDEDQLFIMTRTFFIIHAYISEAKKLNPETQIGISFPYWTNDNNKTDVGDIIRVFALEYQLQSLLEAKPISLLLKRRSIKAFPIKNTPETSSFIRFYRDRRIEKTVAGFSNRKAKKDNENQSEIKILHVKKQKKANFDNTYFFKIPSLSTKQENFSLFIKSNEATKMGNGFSTYGLSNDSDKNSGVPDF